MKKTAKITFCAMLAALAAIACLAAYFPYITYAAPAIAGLMLLPAVIEINVFWAFGGFAASLLPVLLLAETEAKLLYLFFFGWYPIVKALIERIDRRRIEWPIKVAVFNVAIVSAYFVISRFTDVSLEEFGQLGKYGAIIFLIAGNVVFVLYDIAVNQVASIYMVRIHRQIKRLFK